MRLLNVDSLNLKDFRDEDRPRYVAASHRWLTNGEATFQDVRDRRNTNSEGYQKVEAFAGYVREKLSPVKWLWIDTCCINRESAAELSEAINSMFAWYHGAELCLAHLADVKTGDRMSTFEDSEWFKRGWTLQELLAPRTVLFVTKQWHIIGYKGGSYPSDCQPLTAPNREKIIAKTTGIPERVLHNYEASIGCSVPDKMKWMEGRETTRPEDMAYALFGILKVTLPVIYGEKYDSARQRLLHFIHQRDTITAQKAEQYRRMVDWLAPPDPWTNHESARQRHEPQTGTWLLRHNQYLAWKSGSVRLLWVYGKAGCGKTMLCFTAIEDMRTHCQNVTNTGHAFFYFSFSDSHKQTYQNLIVSLVEQLGNKEPGLSMLRQAYEKPERRQPGLDELQKILLASVTSYDQIFLHVDALDECSEGDGVREGLLHGIEQLLDQAPNVRVLVTSRDVSDVRCRMEECGAEPLSIAAQTINADIQKYISTQLSRDRKLSRLDQTTRTSIEEQLAQKADGMFRWVYCQLQELKKSKSTRPSSVQAVLRTLPKDLDETYERMLNNILEDCPYALTFLRWLSYAQSPLSLDELAEASIVDPSKDATADRSVKVEDRGDWEDTLEILAGLVIVEGSNEGNMEDGRRQRHDSGDGSMTQLYPRIGKDTTVRLAHFSVKEYLESSRILTGKAKDFYLDPVKEHRFLAQSCLVYLMHYSSSSKKTSTKQDLVRFPLVQYAAKAWSYHALRQQRGSSDLEMSLLTFEGRKRDWLLVYNPDRPHAGPFDGSLEDIGSALYYASLLGLQTAAQELLETVAAENAQGSLYGTALQAASWGGHREIVELLLDHKADVNAPGGGRYGTALQAASRGGYREIVQLLLDHKANVNAPGGDYGTALQGASLRGHREIVQLLLDHKADVNAPGGGRYGTALQAASSEGHREIVQLLLDHKADVNAPGGDYGTALQAASSEGYREIVQLLLDHKADVNAPGGDYYTALQGASLRGHREIVQLLLDHKADVNAPGGRLYGTALQAASSEGHREIVQLLLDHKADVNAPGGDYGTALQAASSEGYREIVQLLLDHKADVNAPGGHYGTALQAASSEGHREIVQLLLDHKADVNAPGGDYGTALQAASSEGYREIVQLLLDHKADVNAPGGHYYTALQGASLRGYREIVQLLLDHKADVNAPEGDYGTALQGASLRGHREIVQLLLEHGAVK